MEAPEQQQPQRSTTNAYPQIKRELARDTDLRMETREAIARMDFSADSLTRQYSKLLEDTDLTKEARERKAEEAHSHYGMPPSNFAKALLWLVGGGGTT